MSCQKVNAITVLARDDEETQRRTKQPKIIMLIDIKKHKMKEIHEITTEKLS